LHVAFIAPSREHVDVFWRRSVDAGYVDAGAPGERPQYKPDYYGAFLLDPDGTSVEAVHHSDGCGGSHLDHLWIGVDDLDAAERFYTTIAPHAGLRKGQRCDSGVQFKGAGCDSGVQFKGAGTTFSLVHDGRASIQQLHLAFPAPDHKTVEDFHRTAVAAGYSDNGAPGERKQYHEGYFAAYVFDPAGTNVESVFHGYS
jgi:catechol 2,3-dioxygenase-like lactoylglutathione lyase family enzyme